jgi:hypothetical protein
MVDLILPTAPSFLLQKIQQRIQILLREFLEPFRHDERADIRNSSNSSRARVEVTSSADSNSTVEAYLAHETAREVSPS